MAARATDSVARCGPSAKTAEHAAGIGNLTASWRDEGGRQARNDKQYDRSTVDSAAPARPGVPIALVVLVLVMVGCGEDCTEATTAASARSESGAAGARRKMPRP